MEWYWVVWLVITSLLVGLCIVVSAAAVIELVKDVPS